MHVFGEYSRKLSLCIGDNVIALYNGNSQMCLIVKILLQYLVPPTNITDDVMVGGLPGKIIGEVEKLLAVEFCNGE